MVNKQAYKYAVALDNKKLIILVHFLGRIMQGISKHC